MNKIAWEVRSADLEWLFALTSRLGGAVGERRILQELVTAAAMRLQSALGVLYLPDKRVSLSSEIDKSASVGLRTACSETRQPLVCWVQRRNRPLVINSVGRGRSGLMQCKVLCVPVVRESGPVLGMLALYNPPTSPDFQRNQVFLARYIGRQTAGIVEAQFDMMTGVYTRLGLDQMLGVIPDMGDTREASVIYVDIDHTNIANELLGFEIGNELIVRVAQVLTVPVLPRDALVARIYGDRFIVVLADATSSQAVEIANELRRAVSRLGIGPSTEVFDVSISCGVSALLPMEDGLTRAVAAAELACKTAKDRGRNRVELYTFDDVSMMRHRGDALVVGQLRSALKTDRLLLFAQSIVPLQDSQRPIGYEILLRLQDLDGTLISPGPMISAAQRYQLLPSVDRWVVRRALQMLAPYRSVLAARGIGMSINVSGQSIGDEIFIQQFIELLRAAQLPWNSVSVELTEQAAITNLPGAKQMVSRLGVFGCRFALDDFGTGANSLTYLKSLQVDRVKIDGSFVRDVRTDRNSRATVRAIVDLAKGLGIETVAEYVETAEIAHEVRLLGVDYAQGYAFGKPAALSGVLEALAKDDSQRLYPLFLRS